MAGCVVDVSLTRFVTGGVRMRAGWDVWVGCGVGAGSGVECGGGGGGMVWVGRVVGLGVWCGLRKGLIKLYFACFEAGGERVERGWGEVGKGVNQALPCMLSG